MAVCNKGRDDGIKNTKLNINSPKMLGWSYVDNPTQPLPTESSGEFNSL